MQPLAARVAAAAEGGAGAGIGSEAFAALAEGQVGAADVFFHKFYTLQSQRAKQPAAKKKKKKKGDDEEAGSDGSDGEPLSSDDLSGDEELEDFMDKQEGGWGRRVQGCGVRDVRLWAARGFGAVPTKAECSASRDYSCRASRIVLGSRSNAFATLSPGATWDSERAHAESLMLRGSLWRVMSIGVDCIHTCS